MVVPHAPCASRYGRGYTKREHMGAMRNVAGLDSRKVSSTKDTSNLLTPAIPSE